MAVEYGLGRFGDRRLEKGGRICTQRWLHVPDRAFVDWVVRGRARCSSPVFCATQR